MSSDGSSLERLVEAIERHFVPEGFAVEVRQREFTESGQITAEFDVVVSGQVGTTNFRWLIECRDRPSQGAAPGSWIEQLVGRRDRFLFNRVTAVSTTGFAPDAISFASREGIELRTVEELDHSTVAQWFAPTHLQVQSRKAEFTNAEIYIEEGAPQAILDEASAILSSATPNTPLLVNPAGNLVTMSQVWSLTVTQNPHVFDDVSPGAPAQPKRILVSFPEPTSRLSLQIDGKNFPITAIAFLANISATFIEVPISQMTRYRVLDTAETIAETVQFNLTLSERPVQVGVHRMLRTGETVVSVRGSSAST